MPRSRALKALLAVFAMLSSLRDHFASLNVNSFGPYLPVGTMNPMKESDRPARGKHMSKTTFHSEF